MRAGDRIGNIGIVRSLGAGGMGEVYAGFDETLRRKVAVKAIANDRRLSESARSRFLREARLLSRLDHPNICRVYDFIENDAGEFLVLELIEGADLETAMRRDLEPRRKLEIARAVASALAAAHGAGIVHRDLKTGTVMLTNSGEVKVLDFGLARTVDEASEPTLETSRASESSAPLRGLDESNLETLLDSDAMPAPANVTPGDETKAETLVQSRSRHSEPAESPGPPELPEPGEPLSLRTALGAIVGTPLFMSPEQARGELVSTASDMYSFGLMLQAILTGRSPYADDLTRGEILVHAQRGETLPMTGHDADLRKLVGRLKSLAPANRPTAATVLERLDWVLDKPKRLRRRLTVAALLVIAALAGIKYTIDLGRERNLAVARRDQAEDLIDFMLGDLRKKLEPVGRLEILDDVGEKAIEYFASVPEDDLSDDELLSRSKALYQIGEVRIAQRDLPAAEEPFRPSLALAQELSARDPGDGDRLFGVGQSYFWVGYVHWFRGDLLGALAEYQSYLEVSEKLIEIDPDNLDWRLEIGYALTNVAAVYEKLGKLEQALAVVRRSNDIYRDLVAADPTNLDRSLGLAAGLSWYGSMLWNATRLEEALNAFRAESKQRERILEQDSRNPATNWSPSTP